MALQTFDEYLAVYGRGDGDYPVIDLDAADMQARTVLVTFGGGVTKAIVQFFGLAAQADDEHLCIDVHAFVDNQAARSSVFGMEHGHHFEGFADTAPGRSHGRPAVRGVSVLIGAQTDTQPQP